MALTPAQLPTLRADILADAVLNAFPLTSDGATEIAKAYNLPSSPAFWVLRTRVTKTEITGKVSQDGTFFVRAGNGFIGRSVQELMCWNDLFDVSGALDFSLSTLPQTFIDLFSGAGNAALNRAHLLVVRRRVARRIEKLFAASGAGTTADPAVMAAEGLLDYREVEAARALP